jgi:hypothetical protein
MGDGGVREEPNKIAWSSINHAETAPTSSSVRKVRELFRGIYCTEEKIYLQLTHRETVVERNREMGRGAFDLSKGSYI